MSKHFSKMDALSYVAKMEQDGLFEVTPMGPADYFVHVLPLQSVSADDAAGPAPIDYHQVSHYRVQGDHVQRFGYPGRQVYLRLTYAETTGKLTVTRVDATRKRYPIAAALYWSSVAMENSSRFFEHGFDRVREEKSYQPAEIVDILHHAHLAMNYAVEGQGHSRCLSLNMDQLDEITYARIEDPSLATK